MPSDHLTEHAQKIYHAISAQRNQWLTRAQIARMIGKNRLTPYDIALLDRLVEEEMIDSQQEQGFSREGYRWVYGVFNK
jgi:predicted DNA-binding ArsR family transcriptional regulator